MPPAGTWRRSPPEDLRRPDTTNPAGAVRPAALLPRITPEPHEDESDYAEGSGEHDVEARRQAVAGHGDEPGRDEGREGDGDRHGGGETPRQADPADPGGRQTG